MYNKLDGRISFHLFCDTQCNIVSIPRLLISPFLFKVGVGGAQEHNRKSTTLTDFAKETQTQALAHANMC